MLAVVAARSVIAEAMADGRRHYSRGTDADASQAGRARNVLLVED